MATGQRFEMPLTQWSAPSGPPYPGAKLNFYISATSTRLDTFSDTALTVPNTNPVVADGNGTFGPIYLQARIYKVVLTTSTDVQIWTADPVTDNVLPLVLNAVSGLVGINMTPVNVLDITQTQNANSIASLFNDSTGTGAICSWALKNHTGLYSGLTLYGSNYVTSGMGRQDGLLLNAAGAGGLTLNTSSAQSIYLGSNNAVIAQVTSGGCFFAGQTAFGNSVAYGTAQATHGALANGATLDLSCNTGGGGWSGTLIVSNGDNANMNIRTQGMYTVIARGSVATITVINATVNGSGGACAYALSCPGTGIIRLTNNYGAASVADLIFWGSFSN